MQNTSKPTMMPLRIICLLDELPPPENCNIIIAVGYIETVIIVVVVVVVVVVVITFMATCLLKSLTDRDLRVNFLYSIEKPHKND